MDLALHPFVDGNKRIGTHMMLVFLKLNNVEIEYEDDELIAVILSIYCQKCLFLRKGYRKMLLLWFVKQSKIDGG